MTNDEKILIEGFCTVTLLAELFNNEFIESDYFKSLEFQDPAVKKTLSEINIGNKGTLLMFLHVLLVLPKEYLSRSFPNEFQLLNEKISNIATDTSSTYSYDNKNYKYLKHFRNSISHGKVEFLKNGKIKFFDNTPNGNAKFETNIKINDVETVLIPWLQRIVLKLVSEIQNR